MSVKFKVIERGQPGVVGGGVKKHYASVVVSGEKDIEQLTTAIEKISTVSGADIRAVLYALVDVAASELSEGNIVRLGALGYFRISLSSNGLPNAKDVNAAAIKSSKILFTPGKQLKNMQKLLKFEKV